MTIAIIGNLIVDKLIPPPELSNYKSISYIDRLSIPSNAVVIHGNVNIEGVLHLTCDLFVTGNIMERSL